MNVTGVFPAISHTRPAHGAEGFLNGIINSRDPSSKPGSTFFFILVRFGQTAR